MRKCRSLLPRRMLEAAAMALVAGQLSIDL